MKVILMADIKGVGKKDEVINASDGYARNYLFPKKLAVEANSENMTKVKAGENGKIFGGVTAKEIAENLKKQYQIEVDKKKIILPETIKVLGLVTVEMRLYEGITAKLKVDVIAD